MTHLLGVLELAHVAVVVLLADTLGEARDDLDVVLERPLEELVHFAVVVVVVADPKQTVDVVPYGMAECGRIHVRLLTHTGSNKETDILTLYNRFV